MTWRTIILDNPLVWRTAAAVSVGQFVSKVVENSREQHFRDKGGSFSDHDDARRGNYWDFWSSMLCNNRLNLISVGLASTNVTRLDPQLPSTPTKSSTTASAPTAFPQNTKRYDFIILGNGTTGRTAVETLQAKCPGASIALVDPLREPTLVQRGTRIVHHPRVDYIPRPAISLNPRQRRVGILYSNTGTIDLEYKYAVLIATGSHGAPPPSYLIDATAQAKVWELRPTVLFQDASLPRKKSPIDIRLQLVEDARKGQVMGILGSSWDAIDLAIAAASVRKNNRKTQRPALFFGASGPLSQYVPNYLSTAIAKRLRQKGIHIHDRTLIRYINHDEHTGGVQLYSARTFDFLDSTRTPVDQVVVATDTNGPRGNAVLPTLNTPPHLLESRDGRFWYESWSQLSMSSNRDPSMLVCYKDDGRIAVNSELCACTGVYAAGSVAKCGNPLTGHADVAGEGIHDAAMAGKVAALNMARHYQQDSLFSFADGPLSAVMRDAIPVWRSDVLSYDDGNRRPTCLASIGIQALCVGTCDSERYATHGVWWTNQSAQQRILRLLEEDEGTYGDASSITHSQSKERRQRIKQSTKMVYGFGVVYYLDRTGKIQGVMTWGLDFAQSPRHEIKPHLLERMKEVILTNGGMNSIESELDQVRMSQYLGDTSRALVALSFADSKEAPHSSHQLGGSADNFPRPLHRLTDPKLMSIRSHGVLKRKDGHGQGILGEDLFSRYHKVVPDASPPKPITGGVGYASQDAQGQKSFQAAQNWYDYQLFEQRELRWTENETMARPPKEDAIWIRKGDENRNVSAAETRAAVMDSIVGVSRRR